MLGLYLFVMTFPSIRTLGHSPSIVLCAFAHCTSYVQWLYYALAGCALQYTYSLHMQI